MNRTPVIAGSSLLTLIFCVLHFVVRLPNTNVDNKLPNLDEDANAVHIKILNQKELNELFSYTAEFDVEEPIKVKPAKNTKKNNKKKQPVKIMSLEEQNKQSGELFDLFQGNDKYRLMATFNQNEQHFAVIEKINLLNNQKAQIRLNKNEQLANYKIQHILGDSISLVQGERLIQLNLFSTEKNHDK